MFRHIGELGPEQVKLLVLLSLPTAWDALHMLITNIIGTDPGWSCTISKAVDAVLKFNGEQRRRNYHNNVYNLPQALVRTATHWAPVRHARRTYQ